ncbi:Pyranose 2-oxidase [Ceratobasidium sp. 423]|nr:Pyranose 2-oxidase [Ceratobasidium sp. 423]
MSGSKSDPKVVNEYDVLIAGSGPIGCTFARVLLDEVPNVKICMVEMGAQDNPVVGRHHKNSVKYQKDIDAFVNVIKGALQSVSVPPAETYMATLGATAWSPGPGQKLVSSFHNPDQKPELNLPGCAVTRTVGGMATHWTCACPIPHPDERRNSPLDQDELLDLVDQAGKLFDVNLDQYDHSVRHNLVRGVLAKAYPGQRDGHDIVTNLPLAVKRNPNPDYVTWSGTDTVLGKYADLKDKRLTLLPEHKLFGFIREGDKNLEQLYMGTGPIQFAYVKDLKSNIYLSIPAKYYVVACGAVCTPQVLWNSGFGTRPPLKIAPELPALGQYLAEQSIAFCQIILRREYIEGIKESPYLSEELREKCRQHAKNFPNDPIHIPFNDPEPQVTMQYTGETPWHTQIHRDAFSYGDVGPRADPRLIVDLRFFGRQKVVQDNRVEFSHEHTDIYGMPQATFHVVRSPDDAAEDERMMLAMCDAAHHLGSYLPGSNPQFMAPGLALHITGTTRLGKTVEGKEPNRDKSVANEFSQVHGHENLFVGGNNVIPDSMACNPTRTSAAYALKSARYIAKKLNSTLPDGYAKRHNPPKKTTG